MDLIEAFKEARVQGFAHKPEKVVDTQISNVFLYKDKAVKVYKTSDAFFGNLGNKDFRKRFYAEDFSWNQWMSPTIYLSLKPVYQGEGNWKECAPEEADDFFIEMRRVDTTLDLTHHLLGGTLTDGDLHRIGKVMTERIAALTDAKRDDVEAFKRTWKDLLEERLEDLRRFSYMAEDKITREETDRIISKFYDFVNQSDHIKRFDSSKMVVYIDNHANNILLVNGDVAFIDIYPVKDNWRAVDPFHNICRTMADVCVLSGTDKSEAMLKGYAGLGEVGDEEVKRFYMCFNAMIKAAYYFVIQKEELAEKFWKFVRQW